MLCVLGDRRAVVGVLGPSAPHRPLVILQQTVCERVLAVFALESAT